MSFTESMFRTIGKVLITASLAIGSIFTPHQALSPAHNSFGATVTQLPTVLANYADSLASPIGSTDTTMTLVSGQDSLKRNLSGYYCFTIDAQTSIAEFVCGTATGTSVTGLTRGIDPLNPNTTSSSLQFAHRRGASVTITDYTALAAINRILAGTDTVPAVLQYQSGVTNAQIQANNGNLVDYSLLAATSIAGAVNADTTHRGIVQEATQAQTDARTVTGSTGADLYINPGTLRDSLKSDWVQDTGTANTYAFSTLPSLTAYTTGTDLTFTAANSSSGASTLNVNSLGAKTIVDSSGSAIVSGEIKANQIVHVIYNNGQFQMINPTGNGTTDLSSAQTVAGNKTFSGAETFSSGTAAQFTTLPQSSATPSNSTDLTTKTYVDSDFAGGTTGVFQHSSGSSDAITHGLGRTPKIVRIRMAYSINSNSNVESFGVYDGTHTGCVWQQLGTNNGAAGNDGSHIINDHANSITATVSVSSTTFTITWSGATNNAYNLIWEVE